MTKKQLEYALDRAVSDIAWLKHEYEDMNVNHKELKERYMKEAKKNG